MKVHFVGISGIGISALAKYYLYSGNLVSGSDLIYPQDVFNKKEIKKIKFYLGHKEDNLKDDIDLVIYSLAISKENPEIQKALKLKIPIKSYPEALGEITKKYFTIAVSGTHGKSTTTAMISQILIEANFDPLVFIGSKVMGFGIKGEASNFRYGKNKFLIIEADEYKEGFLNHHPNVIVITNIEEDHLDYYKNYSNILKAFKNFVLNLKEEKNFEKILIINKKDKGIKKLIKSKKWLKDNKIKYLFYNTIKENLVIKLKVPGKHNRENALAAIKVAEVLNINKKIYLKALKKFSGIWRRLEFKGFLNGARVYDDYGHHPTEIRATLQAAREILKKNKKLYLVFQPHQYDRTYRLFNKFLKSFDTADFTMILDIYDVKGRENKDIKEKVSSLKLVEKINKKNVIYIPNFDECINFLKENLKPNDVCVIMGAGDIFNLTEKMIKMGIINLHIK